MKCLAVCLAALLAMLPGAAQTAPSARATIYLASHRYSPAPIYLAGGVPVRIMLSNRAGQDHEFVAPEFFRKARLLKGRVVQGEVRVRSGKTLFLDLVPARGTYKVHCGRFGHKMLGMSTMIVVT
jgi:uncharacterized cupredoxin-like copper-binding protein